VSPDHTRVAAGAVATGEKPPQAELSIPPAAFNAPAADTVEVDLTPAAALSSARHGGHRRQPLLRDGHGRRWPRASS